MRFLILVKATQESEAGVMADDRRFEEMAVYHEELARAGVLLDAAGLRPTSTGCRIVWQGGRKTFTDGPFAEAKELIAGYTLIQTKSREEALEWARRFPNPGSIDGAIEVRQLFEPEDFGPAIEERFRSIGALDRG
jgi:hypothetical protein